MQEIYNGPEPKVSVDVRLHQTEVMVGRLTMANGFEEGTGDWREQAECARTEPEAFFPEKGGSTREAKKVCGGCEVTIECLDAAIQNDERFGVWGGLTERERRKIKKRPV
jgi:WhiB family redox-sensing transcriptional regulator